MPSPTDHNLEVMPSRSIRGSIPGCEATPAGDDCSVCTAYFRGIVVAPVIVRRRIWRMGLLLRSSRLLALWDAFRRYRTGTNVAQFSLIAARWASVPRFCTPAPISSDLGLAMCILRQGTFASGYRNAAHRASCASTCVTSPSRTS